MANSTLKTDINKLIEPAKKDKTLPERADRVPIKQARGSGKASENASGAGGGGVLDGVYTSTDGLFTLVFE